MVQDLTIERKVFLGIALIAIGVLLFITTSEAGILDFVLKQKKAVVTIHINDKNGKEIASGTGFIVDRDGIIATNCKLISKWLEDVEYTLTVKTEGEVPYTINKLISYNRRHDTALFEIKAEGLPAVELPSDYKAAEYIKKQVSMYKKFVKTAKKALPTKAPVPAPQMSVSVLTQPQKPLTESAKPSEEPVEAQKLIKIEKKPDNSEEHFMRGLKYESANKYADAIEAYKKALKIKPDYLDAYVNLGLVYYKLSRYSEAIDVYKQAVKIKPDYHAVYNKLGTIYVVIGKYPMALDAFEQALSIDSRNPETHFNLGITYFLSGDKDAALEEYIILNKLDKERAENLFDVLYR